MFLDVCLNLENNDKMNRLSNMMRVQEKVETSSGYQCR